MFRWICRNITYDHESLEPGKRAKMDSATVLQRRKGVCAGFANLFQVLHWHTYIIYICV